MTHMQFQTYNLSYRDFIWVFIVDGLDNHTLKDNYVQGILLV